MSYKRFPDCPFCGSDDLIDPDDTDSVECNGCGAWTESEQKWKARIRPVTLLTWSEPDEAGDIKAGLFTVEKSAHWHRPNVSVFTALLPMEHVGKFADQESAKLACERHARKMLGWEV